MEPTDPAVSVPSPAIYLFQTDFDGPGGFDDGGWGPPVSNPPTEYPSASSDDQTRHNGHPDTHLEPSDSALLRFLESGEPFDMDDLYFPEIANATTSATAQDLSQASRAEQRLESPNPVDEGTDFLKLSGPMAAPYSVDPQILQLESFHPPSGTFGSELAPYPQPGPFRAVSPSTDLIYPPDWAEFPIVGESVGTSSRMSSWVIEGSSEGRRSRRDDSTSWEEVRPDSSGPQGAGQVETRIIRALHTGPGLGSDTERQQETVETARGLTPPPKETAVVRAGDSFSVLHQQRKPQRVRGKLTEEKRAMAKEMRKVGNCLRCRAYKLKCDPDTPCKQCQDVLGSARTFQEPCYRDRIDRVTLARHGNGNMGQRDVAFLDYIWAYKNAASAKVELRWYLPGGRPVDLPVITTTCKQFVTRTNDTHFLTWNLSDGKLVTVELPPYACDDIPALRSEVKSFLDKGHNAVLRYIMDDITDPLQSLTFAEAVRYNDKHSSTVIDLALRIRCAAFCSQGWGSISGAESLGIDPVDFNEMGRSGYAAYDRGKDRPLPLSMDHQFDVALLLTIKEYQKKLLDSLSKLIFKKGGQKPWLEIFLAIFILLSTLEYVHGGAVTFYHSQMKTKHQASCYSLLNEMIDEFSYSAQNLLYHFCSVLRGNQGFKVAQHNMQQLRDRENLDAESVEYMRKVLAMLPKFRIENPANKPRAADDVAAPDGRWIMQLFDRAKV
ncbi:hypothetical protein B0T19DRAFT_79271 [Cercophora scortea]|uniref:Zn(2)-C6 fungal-type domain-containing protein n=1 Tax=Cercophora scortea TaxID=314031 RepID=A0AAE0J630_9PEZI|nr:hypothetical protein B0T19DRAFT_79271 [Cercophora scortea]